MEKNNALAAFAALAQETRLDVLRLLMQAGPAGLQPGEIGQVLGVRQNTLSNNLAVLANAGLVSRRREGRGIRYFASVETMRAVLGYLMEDCCGGRPEVCGGLEAVLACDRGGQG